MWGSGPKEGIKKNPQPSYRRLRIPPAFTLHSLNLEDHFVKNIQAGFLTLPLFQQPSHPAPSTLRYAQGSGRRTVAISLLKGFPFPSRKRAGLQRRVRPRLPRLCGVTRFPSPGYRHLKLISFNKSQNGLSSFFSLILVTFY